MIGVVSDPSTTRRRPIRSRTPFAKRARLLIGASMNQCQQRSDIFRAFFPFFLDEEPILATEAVEALQELEDNEVETDLGFPLVTKAEPYLPKPDRLVTASGSSQTHYLMAALIVSAFVIILVVLALVFLLHRAKRAGLSLKHSRLMGSPDHTTMESSHAQTTPGGSVSN